MTEATGKPTAAALLALAFRLLVLLAVGYAVILGLLALLTAG